MIWVDYHQSKLKSAYAIAMEQLELDRANRKATYDKRTREDKLQIGDHVHLRNRVKGRNQIGDAWDPTVYVVSEQMEDTYVVVPQRGHQKRVINRRLAGLCS